jgi:hypothetical protein
MRNLQILALLGLAAALGCVQPALADDITTSIGTPPASFSSGQTVTSTTFLAATSGQPAPFTGACGSNAKSNCNTNWTFSYTIPGGDTLTGATLTLGIYNMDSSLNMSPFASFTLDGSDNLTTAMNSAADALNGGTGSVHNEYDVLTIDLSSFLADLGGDTATFALVTQGPGYGVLGNTPYLGVGLAFSTLDITATPQGGGGGGPTVPEPATLPLLGLGLVGLVAVVWRK